MKKIAGIGMGLCVAVLGLSTSCSAFSPAQNARNTDEAPVKNQPSSSPDPREVLENKRRPGSGGKDLDRVKCAPDAQGRWSFSARLSNPSKYLSHYTVSVSIAARVTGAFLGNVSQTFPVKPYASTRIDFRNIVSATELSSADVMCGNLVTVVRDS